MASSSLRSRISLLKLRPVYFSWDTAPFIVLYSISVGTLLTSTEEDHVWALLGFIAVFLFHAVCFLSQFWFARSKAFFRFQPAKSLADAKAVLFTPSVDEGTKAAICPLQTGSFSLKDDDHSEDATTTTSVYFEYHSIRFVYCDNVKEFKRLDFPLTRSVSSYLASTGIAEPSLAKRLQEKYGPNKFHIPLPSFMDLFKEHALAPFFVFQVFSILLWCLDGYWGMCMMTLSMLTFAESMVVKSRMRTIADIRNMIVKPRPIMVYRHSKWKEVSSSELVPGDIVSVCRANKDDADAVVPCDLLLLEGNCVVNEALLTGESVPQRKESIRYVIAKGGDEVSRSELDLNRAHKTSVIWGGTRVILHNEEKVSPQLRTADRGCLCYVLRTGFETNQGRLVRTILFSTERQSANNMESLLFILFLLVFAISAAVYTFRRGLEDFTAEERPRWKLLLDCALIITSVVPPELPMELTLAVNTSLMALLRAGIFCTEPFRIPLAGKLDFLCFDKTGTLTSDDMVFSGVGADGGHTDKSNLFALKQAAELSVDAVDVLAGCQSLMYVDDELEGDPMEKAALKEIGWVISSKKSNVISSRNSSLKRSVEIIERFPFDSSLKRMSCIVSVQGSDSRSSVLRVVSKGAPEVMKPMLKGTPADYDAIYLHFARQGLRILALAYRDLDAASPSSVRSMQRSDVECELTFAGFAVFECPLKPTSMEAIRQLRNSSHRVTIITGDNAYTACHVSHLLKISNKPCCVLQLHKETRTPCWQPVMGSTPLRSTPVDELVASPRGFADIVAEHDICVSGDVLALVNSTAPAGKALAFWKALLPYVTVFARVSPEQKEYVMHVIRESNDYGLMCGDGTNDVGALKKAHVGVALLNIFSGGKAVEVSAAPKAPQQPTRPKRPPRNMQEMLKEMQAEADASEPRPIKFGDASIAAPFTTRSSIESTAQLIRQGRCTLVTTQQMFQILALNALIAAYSMSVLALDGVKMSDTQMTVSGMLIAALFLFISRSKPLEDLSAERPHQTIFSVYVGLSVLLQMGVHLWTLITVVDFAKTHSRWSVTSPEDEFKPTLVNTCVFLWSFLMQCVMFAVNYKGKPFMEPMSKNKPILYALAFNAVFAATLATGVMPELNHDMELVPFPTVEARLTFLGYLVLDCVAVFVIDRVLAFVFRNRRRPVCSQADADIPRVEQPE